MLPTYLYLLLFVEWSTYSNSFLYTDIERTDTVWYRALTGHLTAEQQKALQEIILLADQRKAAFESKRIEQSGGKPPFYWYKI